MLKGFTTEARHDLDFEEVQKMRYEPMSIPDQFARDIQRIMTAARGGKIEILEKTVEGLGPNVAFFVVRFKPLR